MRVTLSANIHGVIVEEQIEDISLRERQQIDPVLDGELKLDTLFRLHHSPGESTP